MEEECVRVASDLTQAVSRATEMYSQVRCRELVFIEDASCTDSKC